MGKRINKENGSFKTQLHALVQKLKRGGISFSSARHRSRLIASSNRWKNRIKGMSVNLLRGEARKNFETVLTFLVLLGDRDLFNRVRYEVFMEKGQHHPELTLSLGVERLIRICSDVNFHPEVLEELINLLLDHYPEPGAERALQAVGWDFTLRSSSQAILLPFLLVRSRNSPEWLAPFLLRTFKESDEPAVQLVCALCLAQLKYQDAIPELVALLWTSKNTILKAYIRLALILFGQNQEELIENLVEQTASHTSGAVAVRVLQIVPFSVIQNYPQLKPILRKQADNLPRKFGTGRDVLNSIASRL